MVGPMGQVGTVERESHPMLGQPGNGVHQNRFHAVEACSGVLAETAGPPGCWPSSLQPSAVVMSAVAVCLILSWAVFSPLLPRRWHFDWETSLELSPSWPSTAPNAKLQWKQGRLTRKGNSSE